MKVIICGAGQVGYGIAERLAAENNDVAVIDNSPELVQRVNDTLDVRGYLGHGAHPVTLDEVGARDADMIIAVTLYDEVNMVACQVAHSLFGIPTKIARIRAQTYLEPHWQDLFTRDHMPIDVIISPEIEVGEMVMRRLGLPGAFETVNFAEGDVTFIGVSCDEDCPIINTPLRQLSELFPDLKAIVVAGTRNGTLFVPKSDDSLLPGDDVYIVAKTSEVQRTLKIFGHQEKTAQRVIIAGGGNIGLYVGNKIEESASNRRAKIVELDRERAIEIAEKLDRTVVLNGSALNEEILKEADVTSSDTLIAVTNDDQVNILSSVLARRLGCERNLCLVNNMSYMPLVRSLNIGDSINPRAITVSRILQHVRRGRIRGVHSVHNGSGEVIEAEALETSPLIGVPLKELQLPPGIRIGGIHRKGEVIIPNGETEIIANDRIIIFALTESVRQVEHLFRVSLEYF